MTRIFIKNEAKRLPRFARSSQSLFQKESDEKKEVVSVLFPNLLDPYYKRSISPRLAKIHAALLAGASHG